MPKSCETIKLEVPDGILLGMQHAGFDLDHAHERILKDEVQNYSPTSLTENH